MDDPWRLVGATLGMFFVCIAFGLLFGGVAKLIVRNNRWAHFIGAILGAFVVFLLNVSVGAQLHQVLGFLPSIAFLAWRVAPWREPPPAT